MEDEHFNSLLPLHYDKTEAQRGEVVCSQSKRPTLKQQDSNPCLGILEHVLLATAPWGECQHLTPPSSEACSKDNEIHTEKQQQQPQQQTPPPPKTNQQHAWNF